MRANRKRAVHSPLKTKRRRRVRGTDKPVVSPKFEVLTDGAHAVTIPVHTECFVNGSQGFSRGANFAAARAKKKQRETTAQFLFGVGVSFRGVTLIRLAPSPGLDTGNLWNALKAVQDEIAAHLGIDDGPDSPATWDVGQERAEAYGVRVELRVERAKSSAELTRTLSRVEELLLRLRDASERNAATANVVTAGVLSGVANDLEIALRGAA